MTRRENIERRSTPETDVPPVGIKEYETRAAVQCTERKAPIKRTNALLAVHEAR